MFETSILALKVEKSILYDTLIIFKNIAYKKILFPISMVRIIKLFSKWIAV